MTAPRRSTRAFAIAAAASAILATPAVPARAGAIAPLVPDVATPDLVLRREDWIAREPHTLEDVLRQVPGIAIARSGGQGSPEMVSVLGSPNGRIEWILDGIELTAPELGWPRLYAIPLGIVDRIEIFRARHPVRIAIWTREAELNAAAADFDLGRGNLDSRLRRIQLLTPPRVLQVGLAYDEVLRGEEEFRADESIPRVARLGAFDARTQMARVDLRRGGDVARLSYANDNANTHGTILGQGDVWRTDAIRTALRWDRTVGEATRMALVVGHQAWDHQRTIGGVSGPLREARTHAALDIGRSGPWSAWLRVRTADVNGDGRATGDDVVALRYAQHAAELEFGRDATFDWTAHVGWIDDERADSDFTLGARAAAGAGSWRFAAETGRGVVMAGYGAAGDEPRRRGEWASASAARRHGAWDLRADVFTKSMRDRLRATGAFFPGSGAGPRRLSGVTAQVRWQHGGRRWRFAADASGAWTPHAEGDRAGLAEEQGSVRADVGTTFRSGDLTLDGYADWTFESERRWGDTAVLGSSLRGDVGIDIGFIERLHFFYSIRNVTDAVTAAFPGVRLPVRTSLLGVRVRIVD